jgi:hypothetical protein
MRKVILTLSLFCIFNLSFGQPKTVKINLETGKIYLPFFYKLTKTTRYTLNDSVYFLCRKINPDKFFLDKYVNKQKEWTKVYRIEQANDSLNVTTRVGGKDARHRFEYSKEKYYNSFQIDF